MQNTELSKTFRIDKWRLLQGRKSKMRALKAMVMFVVAIAASPKVYPQETKRLLMLADSDILVVVNGSDSIWTEANRPTGIELLKGEHLIQVFDQNGSDRFDTIVSVMDTRQEVFKLSFAKKEIPSNANFELIDKRDIQIKGRLVSTADVSPQNGMAYSLLKGDSIRITVDMANDKGKNFLKVISYPNNNVVFSARKFQNLDKTFEVPSGGIYVLNLTSAHAFDRQAHIEVRRKPNPEREKDHKVHVEWELYYETVVVQEAQEFNVNGGVNASLQGGKSRVLLPIDLPKNTVKWFYEYGAYREDAEVKKAMDNFELAGKLVAAASTNGASLISIGAELLSAPPGANICDLYLLDRENSSLFMRKVPFTNVSQARRENYKSGIVEMKGDLGGKQYFIGIKNPSRMHGIHVIVDVVAIVKKGRWVSANN